MLISRWNKIIFNKNEYSKFKKGVTPRKKIEQNFLWICTCTHYVLHNYKVSQNSVERFQWSVLSTGSIFNFGLSKFKIESEFPVNIHIYTLRPSLLQRFRTFLLCGFRGVALTNYFSSIFILVKFLSSKRT